jgi:hypothetical protein
MTSLLLVPANKSRGSDHCGPLDYDVRHDDRVVGRIFCPPQAPPDQPWFWTILEGPSMACRGYAATREDAMAAFKAAWSTSKTDGS